MVIYELKTPGYILAKGIQLGGVVLIELLKYERESNAPNQISTC